MNFRSEVRSLLQGSMIGRVISGLTNALLTHVLGIQSFGALSLFLQLAQTSESLSKVGLDYALPYYLAKDPKILRSQSAKILASGSYLALVFSILGTAACVLYVVCTGSNSLLGEVDSWLFIITLFWIVAECFASFQWDLILAQRKIDLLAMRQSLFVPLRVVLALSGGIISGLAGAICGVALACVLQLIFLLFINAGVLKRVLTHRLSCAWPAKALLKRGLPYYANNLAGQIVFFPLLMELSVSAGLESVSMVRIGQVIAQVFALLGGSLAPVLFMRLRSSSSGENASRLTGLSVNLFFYG